jgi:hypothetical protein
MRNPTVRSLVNHTYLNLWALTSINSVSALTIMMRLIQFRTKAMSIHDYHSHGGNACANPFSPTGLIIIGALVLLSMGLWQHGPSVGTLVLLPLMLICPMMHFFMHRHRN